MNQTANNQTQTSKQAQKNKQNAQERTTNISNFPILNLLLERIQKICIPIASIAADVRAIRFATASNPI